MDEEICTEETLNKCGECWGCEELKDNERFWQANRTDILGELEKIGYYWYEDSCWKCDTCRTKIPVGQRTRYPNVSDTAWACNKCNDAIIKEYEETRNLMYKE